MADTFSPTKRREIMQSIRRKGTKPENTLALLLDEAAIKYNRNVEELPGKPDFVFDDADLVVFVHGCFWHGHKHCHKGLSLPKTRRSYWKEKINRNMRRDQRVARELRTMGYSVFTVWECELRSGECPQRILRRLTWNPVRCH